MALLRTAPLAGAFQQFLPVLQGPDAHSLSPIAVTTRKFVSIAVIGLRKPACSSFDSQEKPRQTRKEQRVMLGGKHGACIAVEVD